MIIIESSADVTYLDEDGEPFVSHRGSAFAWPMYAEIEWRMTLMFLRMQEPEQAEALHRAFKHFSS